MPPANNSKFQRMEELRSIAHAVHNKMMLVPTEADSTDGNEKREKEEDGEVLLAKRARRAVGFDTVACILILEEDEKYEPPAMMPIPMTTVWLRGARWPHEAL